MQQKATKLLNTGATGPYFSTNAPDATTNGKQTKPQILSIFKDITAFIPITLKAWQAESNTLQ